MNNVTYIHAMAMNSALGDTHQQQLETLAGKRVPSMHLESGWLNDGKETVVGKVLGELPVIPEHLTHKNTRNNQLALSAILPIASQIKDAISEFGADRVAVVVATSTSGISDGEVALSQRLPDDYHYHQQEVGNLGQFVADYFALEGPAYTISTACSSSGRVFISANRLLNAGLADVVIVAL